MQDKLGKYAELGYTLKAHDENIVGLWFKERLVDWWVNKMPPVDEILKVCYNDVNKSNGGEK